VGTPTKEPLIRIAFVSTYPPRRCGIATFTNDLSRATDDREIVALSPPDHAEPYPTEVHHRIRRDMPDDYPHVARALERCRITAVSIQHEYGIWGGHDGEYVLDFVDALAMPAVATLHTVLRNPTSHQRRVLVDLVAATSATVVMSRSAASLLSEAYGVDPTCIEVIPHGVPDLPLVDPETIKSALNLEGREVILSFGLMGPGKGLELAIDAMASVVTAAPNARYVILGATHPDLLRREGETYRHSLVARVEALGLTEHILFVDRFVGRSELGRWLEAADLFVTPYPNLDQIVSGTLSYAMSAGKAIVSTPYAYAAELLADGRGVLVDPGSSAAVAAAFISLLGDPTRRSAIGARAYAHSRRMIWPQVGRDYGRVFARVAGAAVLAGTRVAIGALPTPATVARRADLTLVDV
jgi:glycosyltransferase involved in cell wall biosynthesis